MNKRSEDNLLVSTLNGTRHGKVPFWFMRQAGRYLPEYRKLRSKMGGFWDLVFNPEKAAEVTLQPIERFDMDGAILFSDILVIPHALGQKVSFVEKVGPVLEELDHTKPRFALEEGHVEEKLGSIFETIRLVKKSLMPEKALIGFAGGPWTVATYMIEGKGSPEKRKTCRFFRENPDQFRTLMEMITKETIVYLKHQVEAGADVLQIFDSWAGALNDNEGFEVFCLEPTRKIRDALKKEYPDIPLIGFPKGIGENYKPYFKQTAIDAISLDWEVETGWAAEELQPLGCVQGNLAPQMLIEGGDKMLRKAEEILKTFSKGPHVFNLGHGIVPQVPPEHVSLLSEFLKDWRNT